MLKGQAVRRSHALLRLRLGDHLIRIVGESQLGMVQSAVALLRTVFEDHYVDPEHNVCLLYQGCTLPGSPARTHDFSVTLRRDRVILSDFTFSHQGPAVVSVPLNVYATEILRFSLQVSGSNLSGHALPPWQQQYLSTQQGYLQQLQTLTDRLIAEGGRNHAELCAEFQEQHGELKRPLEMHVLTVLASGAPRQPAQVVARITFGPVRAGEVMPMRLNRGDVILVTVNEFASAGIVLTLEGVGSGGVRPGDRLYGLQLFYP